MLAKPLLTYLPGIILIACGLMGQRPAQAADTSLAGWYQVDVILFRPASTNLDEESWPEVIRAYPAGVTAVYQGNVFNLSQLEQATDSALLPVEPEAAFDAGTGNNFVFAEASSRDRNQRVIERVSGIQAEQAPASAAGAAGLATTDMAAGTDAGGLPATGPSVRDLIRDAIAAVNPDSPGKLAFADRSGESSLQNILRSLKRSSRFVVLDQLSWVQPIDEEAIPILIQAGDRYDDLYEIEGTLAVSRTRFLHVQTNLWYTVFEPRGGSTNPYLTGFQSTLPNDVLTANPALVKVERERGQYFAARTHTMAQTRRMRSDELHYIDHPLFGIVVKINRFNP